MMISPIRAARFALAISLAAAAGIPAARAEDSFFYGKWKITGAVAAPWATPGTTPDSSEAKTLVGQTIELSADAVQGPGSFPCSNPHYEVLEGGPDMLFQGSFGEMHDKDKSVDPQKLAEQVGFSGTKFRTVVTGCEYEVDFSFGADNDAAAFGLNDHVYTLKRE
jgi:hypothetical protein